MSAKDRLASGQKYTPAISVVIPAYNEEKLLGKLLKRLQEQTFQDFTVIVIDNNSTDKTVALAKHFNAEVITETKQGYVHALNRGLQEAKSPIVAVTDADSLPDRHWLMAIAKSFEKNNIIGLTGKPTFDVESAFVSRLTEHLSTFFMQVHFLIGKPHTVGFNLAAKKEYIQKIGKIDPAYQIGADVYVGLALKKHGKVIFEKDAVVRTSTRRLKKEAGKSLLKYSAAYLYTVWLNKPAPVKLIAIR